MYGGISMSEFHFESIDYDTIIFREEEIRTLTQQIRAIIDEYGIDEFCKRIRESLEKHSGEYKINGRCCDACENTNK